jgi:hypothetical protein
LFFAEQKPRFLRVVFSSGSRGFPATPTVIIQISKIRRWRGLQRRKRDSNTTDKEVFRTIHNIHSVKAVLYVPCVATYNKLCTVLFDGILRLQNNRFCEHVVFSLHSQKALVASWEDGATICWKQLHCDAMWKTDSSALSEEVRRW